MSLSVVAAYQQLAAMPWWATDVLAPFVILHIFYWLPGLAFLALDNLRWSWWSSRKCQPDKRLPRAEVLHICWYVGVQLVTVYPLAFWALAPLARARLRYSVEELPDATTFVLQLAGFALSTEAYFYYTHRLLHHPALYPHLHKVHHRFTYPIAIECLYFHPVESVMQLGTVMLGPLLLRSHVTMMWAWEAIALLNIALHHAGHDVPLDEVHAGSRMRELGSSCDELNLCFLAGAGPRQHGAPARLPPHGLQRQLRRDRPARQAARHARRLRRSPRALEREARGESCQRLIHEMSRSHVTVLVVSSEARARRMRWVGGKSATPGEVPFLHDCLHCSIKHA